MTVKKLIELLKAYPQKTTVFAHTEGWGGDEYEVTKVDKEERVYGNKKIVVVKLY